MMAFGDCPPYRIPSQSTPYVPDVIAVVGLPKSESLGRWAHAGGGLGDIEGLIDADGLTDGDIDGLILGLSEGDKLGLRDGERDADGDTDGDTEGEIDGLN